MLMARRRRETRKTKLVYTVVTLIIALALALTGYFFGDEIAGFIQAPDGGDTGANPPDTGTDGDGDTPLVGGPVEGTMDIHFIDVGQADAILVIDGGKVMLVDTGDTGRKSRDALVAYLENMNITKIDYLILTHPDADHIGGAPTVIETFDVESCIMPNAVKDTVIYENTLYALENGQVNVIEAVSGDVYTLDGAQFKVLAPNSEEYEDWNDYSVVIKLVFGESSIMLTGDAHVESESEILAKYDESELDCDVLKAGHHGSRTSTGDAFLAAVSPDYVVISCGEGNSYGHPHSETLDKLEEANIPIYRTDLLGTVVLHTDGETITFTFEKSAD